MDEFFQTCQEGCARELKLLNLQAFVRAIVGTYILACLYASVQEFLSAIMLFVCGIVNAFMRA
jgi:hypothetical protein